MTDWESEGGSLGTKPDGRIEQEHSGFPPSLPLKHEAHSVWAFNDPTGRFSYEFNRVYAPSGRLDSCGPVLLLDTDRSYWGVTWTALSDTGEDRREGRWMSYAQARKLGRSRLTFERFSSLLGMRDELPELLGVADPSAGSGR